MTRSVPSTRAVLTSLFTLAGAVAAGCGHSDQVLQAFEAAKKTGIVGGGNTDAGGSSATGGTGTGNESAGGMAPVLPNFDCNNANPQFDSAHMQPFVVSKQLMDEVNSTLQQMGPADKASQMIGVPVGQMDYEDIERSPDTTVAGLGTIRGYNYRDAGRGVNLDAGQKNNRQLDANNFSTVFPAPSIRAASWDMDLEKRAGEAMGDEVAASLNNMLLAPCMNIIRHPYWGRTQETYGEDSYATGRMATAFTVGLQQHVTGCAKHFAANNIEKLRSTQNAIMTEQTLREIYARHFEMVIQDGGVGCIMASYNMINNVKSTQNKHLLRDILKAPIAQGGMGYQGLVISDWWAMPGDQNIPSPDKALSDTQEAALAGLDIEVPWTLHYSTNTLMQADPDAVEEAARRVLTQKYRFKTALSTDDWGLKKPVSTMSGASIASNQAHEDLAEEAELKSAVLLKNGLDATMPVLPLTSATKIAVVGPDQDFQLGNSTVPKSCPGGGTQCTFKFATDPALGDRGSSRVNGDPARSVGPFAGIQAAAGSRMVTSGNSAAAVGDADAVVVVVGYTPADEGEEYAILSGGDRASLNLPMGQNEFVTSVLDLNKPTVIIIESGSIVNLPWLAHSNKNQATIWAGYPGLRGGNALGKLIFAVGGANFSGKVPLAWPTQAEQDKMVFKESETATHMGYFFGYREYDRRKMAGDQVDLVFPFGHGMSYSTFEYSGLKSPCDSASAGGVVKFTVDVKNTSTVDGDEVVMMFVKPPAKPATIMGERPVKELKSFARVSVKAGMTTTAELPLRIRDLRRWEGDTNGKWVIDSGAYDILVGKDADDAEKSTTKTTLMINGN
jgi:beta-glucosidase